VTEGEQIQKRASLSTGVTQALIDWFWEYGHQRRTRYRLPPTWVLDAYKQLDACTAIVNSLAQKKPTIAVWGPSRSGKSTLLSYFIDSPDGPDSALSWTDQAFRFLRSAQFESIESLNPLNTRSDASGCVTRFFVADEVKSPTHPVEIILASRRQTLQALAAGYVTECKLEQAGIREREWDSEHIYALLSDGRDVAPNQDATEVLLDVVSVIDRLIEDEYPRYWNLRGSNNDWERVLRAALLSDPVRSSSLASAAALAVELLWDSKQKLTDLFAELESYRKRLRERFGEGRVFASLKLTALLLDIETFPLLMRRGESDARRAREIKDQLSRVVYQEHEGFILIDVNGPGKPLFDKVEEFGFLQALVWEIQVPLKRDFLASRSDKAGRFLDHFDVLDVPGVARQYQKASSEKLDVEAPGVDSSDLLIQVVKRGKTATIINRYAEQMLIDAVLILMQAGEFPAQPAQIIGGVQSIWRAYDANYNPSRGRPPIPVAICLTFMAAIVDEMSAAGPKTYELAPLDNMITQLGPVAHQNVRTMFMTTYPHLPAGSFKTSEERRRSEILPKILSAKWFQDRFRSQVERDSISALLFDEDGGVGYLLTSLASLSGESRVDRLEKRLDAVRQETDEVIRRALPVRNLKADQYRAVVEKLVNIAEERLQRKGGQPDEIARALSIQLRAAFAFKAEDFQPYPKMMAIDVDNAVVYLQKQLDNWLERKEAKRALADLGLSDSEQMTMLDAVRKMIDVAEVATWCTSTFGAVSDEFQAHHIRRYVAAKCAGLAMGGHEQPAAAENAVVDNMDAYCIAKYREWSLPNRTAACSAHAEAVILPMVARLREIAMVDLATRWEDQIGDPQIEKIFAGWQAGRGE
jgi:hypothetical protein